MADRYIKPLPEFSQSQRKSFWKCVQVGAPGDCWLWMGRYYSHSGYGRFFAFGYKWLSHRLAYHFHFGLRVDQWQVLHTCDNPPCCNPRHLFLGTNADNVADRVRKGRSARLAGDLNGSRIHPESRPRGAAHPYVKHPELIARGSRHGNAKLTEQQVRRILSRETEAEYLAWEFGVSIATIYSIWERKGWRHVQLGAD